MIEGDKLMYVNYVLKGKLLESPNLDQEFMNAVMDAGAAYASMPEQVLESERVRNRLKRILLGPSALYEALRQRGQRPREYAPPG